MTCEFFAEKVGGYGFELAAGVVDEGGVLDCRGGGLADYKVKKQVYTYNL